MATELANKDLDNKTRLIFLISDPETKYRLDARRDLTDGKVKKLESANKLLAEIFQNSPYMNLQNRLNDLADYYYETISKMKSDGRIQPSRITEIYKKLDGSLSALKGFEDRTKSLISSRYGKKSEVMEEFEKALAYEFDNSFAYRFSYNMRNYIQHNSSHIGNVSVSIALGEASLTITLNPTKLLEAYDGWHRFVKRDLEAASSDFELIDVINELKVRVYVIFAKYVLSQSNDIEDAIGNMTTITGSFDIDASTPHYGTVKNDSETKLKVQLTKINFNLANTYTKHLDSMRYYSNSTTRP